MMMFSLHIGAVVLFSALFIYDNVLSQSDTGSCTLNEFECQSGLCIRPDWTCDDIADCPGGDDEQGCDDGDVRLADGNTQYEGRVEVYYNGAWGTVCDDGWDTTNGDVACSQLGFGQASEVYSSAHFGAGTGSIILDDVECVGGELRIAQCAHRGFGVHNCAHSKDAGVRCQPTPGSDIVTVPPAEQDTLELRLVNGNTQYEGRVEVYYNGAWGTVCDDGWHTTDGDVVCAQLGYGRESVVYNDAHFGEGTGIIVLDNVQCAGGESRISQCTHNGYGVHNCGHGEDAGVRCLVEGATAGPAITFPVERETGQLRLVDGNTQYEGRVEVYYNGAWGTVCDDEWDIADGDVVCAQLGFGRESVVYSSAHFGEGTGIIVLDDVECVGGESSITQCTHRGYGVSDCDHAEDAGVRCLVSPIPMVTGATDTVTTGIDSATETSQQQLRLADGNTPYEGRVEVYYNGAWGTVCDDDWGTTDGDVVCAQLGFGRQVAEIFSSAYFGEGTGIIVLDNVGCSGDETNLLECSHAGLGINDCGHSEDAGVRCYPPDQGGAQNINWRYILPAIAGAIFILYVIVRLYKKSCKSEPTGDTVTPSTPAETEDIMNTTAFIQQQQQPHVEITDTPEAPPPSYESVMGEKNLYELPSDNIYDVLPKY